MPRTLKIAMLLTLTLAAPLSAQYGIRGGLSLSEISGDGFGDGGSRSGFTIGAYHTKWYSDNFGIETSAAFTQKGATAEESGVAVRAKIDYLDTGMFFVFRTAPSDGKATPLFYFGPTFASRLGCDVEGSIGGVTVSMNCDDPDLADAFVITRTDYGILGGIGLVFGVSPGANFRLDAMVNLGLSDIDELGFGDANRNRTLMLMAGISF